MKSTRTPYGHHQPGRGKKHVVVGLAHEGAVRLQHEHECELKKSICRWFSPHPCLFWSLSPLVASDRRLIPKSAALDAGVLAAAAAAPPSPSPRCPSSFHRRRIRTRPAGSAASHARGPPWLSAASGAPVRPRSSGAGRTAERRSGQVPLLRGRRVGWCRGRGGCASAPGVPGREGGRRGRVWRQGVPVRLPVDGAHRRWLRRGGRHGLDWPRGLLLPCARKREEEEEGRAWAGGRGVVRGGWEVRREQRHGGVLNPA